MISPISTNMTGSVTPNMTAEAALGSADTARFQSMLDGLKKKADAGSHVVTQRASSKEDKDLKEACKGFEAMFLSMMYKEMRATVGEDPLFGESNATKIFRDMQDEEMMKGIADAGGIGLGDMLYKQLSPQVLKKSTK